MVTGTYTIGKRVRFEAARELDGVDASDSFTAEVVLTARELTRPGFVCDFGELAGLQEHVDAVLDHRDLNAVLADASDKGIAEHLHASAEATLPGGARERLSEVRILTGRPVSVVEPTAVRFRARHWLCGLPAGHKCGRPHGHAYVVTLPFELRGDQMLPIPGQLRAYLLAGFHQQVLNEVLDVNPTSEHLAAHLARWLTARGLADPAGRPFIVRVSETESTWAQFAPDAGAST
ncbi:6-carboxytetrahydropterin synthase [Kitasatospora sp. NPDC088160]|uniref:6-carboxytetrahydropterin synthase n=1 Tax=Kitasatospora sp. NPDC088160 TaxID=3364072 RepID=UPI003819EB62